jgi:flagellar secretion chaperone FliS
MTVMQHNKYLETSIQTATPAQLLLMLYDGAIRFCRQAIGELKAGNLEGSNTYLQKTQNIIDEFVITLDRSSPLAENLLMLYEYFKARLTEANMKKTPEPAEEVLGYLMELKESFMQAGKLATQTNNLGVTDGTTNFTTSKSVV